MCECGDLREIIDSLVDHAHSVMPFGEDRPGEVVARVSVDGEDYALVRYGEAPEVSNSSLSPRETEIVRLVASGMPNKAIAEVLDISPWTVATHIRRIFMKLGVHSRAHMIASLVDDAFVLDPAGDRSASD